MNTPKPNPPLPVRPPPDVVDAALEPLLSEPFARAWGREAGDAADVRRAVRGRLLERLAASRAAEAQMVTMRRRRLSREPIAEGVVAQTLYTAADGAAPRPGEPLRTRLLELAPGARLDPSALGPDDVLRARHREWLVLEGGAHADERWMSRRDYLVTPAGAPTPAWRGEAGALVFLRESALAARPGDVVELVRDADAGWDDYGPGIRRRVLWTRDGQASLLYHAQPGAEVPQHRHGHDEECLTVQGELFLDDLLLQPGDYQLARAGSGHRVTHTDTGVVIYAHGDLELDFVA